MIQNRFFEIGGPAVVEKEQTLSKPPERRSAELVGPREALGNAIGQSRAHVMQRQV